MIYGSADAAERAFQAKKPFNATTLARPSTFKGGSTFAGGAPTRPVAATVRPVAPTVRPTASTVRPGGPVIVPIVSSTPAGVFDRLIQKATGAAGSELNRAGGLKQGPQGVTINDVAAVAAGQVPGWRPGKPLPSATQLAEAVRPSFQTTDVYGNLIGAPAPTAGERYGGFQTATEFKNQVLGEAYNALLAGRMAGEEAQRLAAPYQEAYDIAVNPEGSAVQMTLANNQRILDTPLADLARQMAGGRTPTQQDYYAANMARMNAARGTGDYGEAQVAQNALQMVTRPAERNLQAGLMASGALRQQELADIIGGVTMSDLAQQIATQRYGQDPGQAAGLFPVDLDLAYQQSLIDAANAQTIQDYGLDPNASTAEIILALEGPEGLQAYQQRVAERALYGSPSEMLAAEQEQLDAENALIDEEARTVYGFDPKKTGFDPDYVRSLLTDETFMTALTTGRNNILTQGADPLEESSKIASDYARTTGDVLAARVIGEILASFDLSYFGA